MVEHRAHGLGSLTASSCVAFELQRLGFAGRYPFCYLLRRRHKRTSAGPEDRGCPGPRAGGLLNIDYDLSGRKVSELLEPAPAVVMTIPLYLFVPASLTSYDHWF